MDKKSIIFIENCYENGPNIQISVKIIKNKTMSNSIEMEQSKQEGVKSSSILKLKRFK